MDEALIDLQTRVAFQEESIQALNRALLDQQQFIICAAGGAGDRAPTTACAHAIATGK